MCGIFQFLNHQRQFKSLVKKNQKKYLKLLETNGLIQFRDLILNSRTVEENYKTFQDLYNHSAIKSDILEGLINPYYIGMGNPKSELLIFGQELALEYDPDKIKTLEGIFQEQLFHHKLTLFPDNNFFNPRYAKKYRNPLIHSHTWGVYSKIVAKIYSGNSYKFGLYFKNDYPNIGEREKSFEDFCFFTELYAKPSPRHNHSRTSDQRMELFKSNGFRKFINGFKYIVIGCKSFYQSFEDSAVNDTPDPIEEYFGIKCDRNKVIQIDGTDKKAKIVKSKKQVVVLFNRQLSNAWSYDYIDKVFTKVLQVKN
jgi:hypothetical protein